MKIDLHIHTKTGSDGAMTIEEVFAEAKRRNIEFISITDHDNIEHQGRAIALAAANKIRYVTGVELNVTFVYNNKSFSLDFLGYGYDYRNTAFKATLRVIKDHREKRARQIIDNLNSEFKKENLSPFYRNRPAENAGRRRRHIKSAAYRGLPDKKEDRCQPAGGF